MQDVSYPSTTETVMVMVTVVVFRRRPDESKRDDMSENMFQYKSK